MSDPEKPTNGSASPETGFESPASRQEDERGLVAVEVEDADDAPAGGTVVPRADEILALRKERDDLRDQLLRRRADFENYKRRVERDRQSAFQESTADLLRALVPTLDNLERALASENRESSVREGVVLIQRELLALLEGRGLSVEDPTGRPFDPERHQALSHDAVAGVAPGTVVEVFRKGYLFKDRLLRPALVKVAKESESPEGGRGSEPDQ